MLGKFSIGKRLGFAFGLLTLLSLLFGLMAYSEISAMNSQWQTVKEDAIAKSNATTKGSVALGSAVQMFKNYVLRGEDYDKRLVAQLEIIDSIDDDYKATGRITPEEERILAKVHQDTLLYLSLIHI